MVSNRKLIEYIITLHKHTDVPEVLSQSSIKHTTGDTCEYLVKLFLKEGIPVCKKTDNG